MTRLFVEPEADRVEQSSACGQDPVRDIVELAVLTAGHHSTSAWRGWRAPADGPAR